MNNNSDDMHVDYSELFARTTPVRAKHYEAAMCDRGFVRFEEEFLKAFPTSAELNAALLGLVEASRHVH